jgi:hypothetical protein
VSIIINKNTDSTAKEGIKNLLKDHFAYGSPFLTKKGIAQNPKKNMTARKINETW